MKWELFMSTFCLVYLLGVQQLNVQGNHILLAMLTSLAIGTANLLVIRGASVLDWHSQRYAHSPFAFGGIRCHWVNCYSD